MRPLTGEVRVTVRPAVSTTKWPLAEARLPAWSAIEAVRVSDPSGSGAPGVQRAACSSLWQVTGSAVPLAVKLRVAGSTPLSASPYVRSISGRAWSTKVPETGAVRAIRGGVVSRRKVTCATACPTFPAVSVATAVIVLAPSTRVTVAVKALPDSAAGWPLTVTLAIPPVSVAVPVTWSEALVTVWPSVGLVMATAGGVVSPFWRVTWTVACPTFPAASVAATVIVLAPAVRETGAVKAPPESGTTWPLTVTRGMALASVTVPLTWIGELAKTCPAVGLAIATTGGRVSVVKWETACPALPAWSARVRSIVCAPSASPGAGVKVRPVAVTAACAVRSAPSRRKRRVESFTPERLSVQEAWIAGVAVARRALLRGWSTWIAGATRSRLRKWSWLRSPSERLRRATTTPSKLACSPRVTSRPP